MYVQQPKMLKEYVANREQLLKHIIQFLKEDGRFIAAWLTGSFGRNDADDVSDLDLTIVVDNAFAKTLCARPDQIGAKTIEARYDLFSQFGELHIIHDNHHNAPADSSFTFTLYKETALVVDWILRPDVNVTRPALSVLLFDEVDIAVEPLPSVENLNQRAEMATGQVAFFWMMATVTVKYLIRQDEVYFHRFLDMLHGVLWDVRRLVAGKPDQWIRGSLVDMATTQQAQIISVRQICQEMMDVMPDVEKIGGTVPIFPMSTLQILINFAETGVDIKS